MKHKKISFLTVFMALLLLFQLFATSALADNNEPVTLKNVRLGTEIYNIAEDNTITINTEDKVTEIGLIFSHNVENQDYLEDNIDKVTLTEITAEGDLVVTIDVQGLSGAYDDPDFEGSQTGLLIVPEYDLTDGHYKIEVDRGVQANAGSTTKDYTIELNVGEADTGEIDPDARKISFDVNAPNPSISVKDSKNKVYYSEDGTTFYLPDGSYTYTVAATGYVTVQGEFTVAGEDDVITIDDMRDEVEVTINVTPSDAAILLKSGQNEYIDPEEEGGNVFVVTPGIEYTYSCIREGYIVTSSRFTPVVDQELKVTMEKNSGSGYTEQGFSNTLTLLNPGASQIEVVESATDADGYFYNRITKSLDNTKDLTFGFTMGAGINAFNEDFFLEQNMPQIGVYQYDGVGKIGKEMATEKNGKLSYVGFADREITISVEAGTLPDGTYILYFGKDICGNNANKTLGVPVMFEFKIGDGGSSTGGGGGGGGTTGGNTGNDNNNTNNGNQGTGNNTGNETGTGFNDVKTTDWYADAVAFVVEEKLFEGTSANAFEPNSAMTRSMLVTVLGRMNGGEIKGNASFTDVAAGAWYTDSIA